MGLWYKLSKGSAPFQIYIYIVVSESVNAFSLDKSKILSFFFFSFFENIELNYKYYTYSSFGGLFFCLKKK